MESKLARIELEKAVVRAMEHASSNVMQWGVDDCALWSAMPVNEVYGYDACAECRGKYDSRAGALIALGTLGIAYAVKRAAKKYGWQLVPPNEAKVGDIGLAMLPIVVQEYSWETTDDGYEPEQLLIEKYANKLTPVTMVCRAPGWFIARNENGFTALKSDVVRIAWSVVRDNTEYAD